MEELKTVIGEYIRDISIYAVRWFEFVIVYIGGSRMRTKISIFGKYVFTFITTNTVFMYLAINIINNYSPKLIRYII